MVLSQVRKRKRTRDGKAVIVMGKTSEEEDDDDRLNEVRVRHGEPNFEGTQLDSSRWGAFLACSGMHLHLPVRRADWAADASQEGDHRAQGPGEELHLKHKGAVYTQ